MPHHHFMSSLPRIYCTFELKAGAEISLEPASSHHLVQVLRLKIGDCLVVFNGSGGEYLAKLNKIDKKSARIYIEKIQPGIPESPLKIHLGQSIARGEKMDFIVQKAVELGVSEITPLFSEFCNVRLEEDRSVKRVVHWQEVAIHAAEQCGRCIVPKINMIQDLQQWAEQVAAELKLVLSPAAKQNLNAVAMNSSNIAILIGPEGGLSEKEIVFTKQYDFISIKLGPRILRTETAALVAVSILQARAGDMCCL